jgi:DedD protein
MRGVFDEKELEPVPARRDTELTLSSGTLLAIFFGLVLLCGLCFGLGYAVGHRGSQPLAMASGQPSPGALPLQSGSSVAKPPATPLAPAAAAPAEDTLAAPGVAGGQPAAASSSIAPSAAAETLPAPVQAAPSQPLVHPALTSAVAVSQAAQPGSAGTKAAFAPASATSTGGLMVQIAAVSNSEDATVLTNALRKHGYAVTVRRDPADNLVHVRIGPFATVAEANIWKTKLLNDGYNAIVQP